MTLSEKAKLIKEYFDELLPNTKCELNYTTDYSFLIAVMLSAQTTDKKVNKVTEILFNKYKNLESLKNAKYEDIYEIIKPLGLAKNKTKNVIEIAKELDEKFNGKVPINKVELMSLPGVGNKTANVVHIELFKIPEFPVDTHVERVSKRLSLCNENDSVTKVEETLKKIFLEKDYIKLHHQFIHFGRYFCKAKNPICENCKLASICKKASKS